MSVAQKLDIDEAPEVKVVDIAAVNAASAEWAKAKKLLDKYKEAEAVARKALVDAAFPNGLSEGTNTLPLAGKWKLKVTGVVSRSVDEAALEAIKQRIAEKFDGYDAGQLIKWKPELAVTAYKDLVKTQPKIAKLFDNALTIKGTGETSPQLKIEESKR